MQMHEAFSEYPFQTKSLPACAVSCNEEEEQQHRPDREAYVEVVDETHVHPVDHVPHVSWRGGKWSPLAHLALPRKEVPLLLSSLVKGCPGTVGPLERWWCGQLLGCIVTEALPDLPSFADGRVLLGWKRGSWRLYFQLRCCWAGWQLCLEVAPSAWHERM